MPSPGPGLPYTCDEEAPSWVSQCCLCQNTPARTRVCAPVDTQTQVDADHCTQALICPHSFLQSPRPYECQGLQFSHSPSPQEASLPTPALVPCPQPGCTSVSPGRPGRVGLATVEVTAPPTPGTSAHRAAASLCAPGLADTGGAIHNRLFRCELVDPQMFLEKICF